MALLLNLLAYKVTRDCVSRTACARAEVGWSKESGCGIRVMNVADAKRKRQPKEKQSFS